MNAKQVKPSPKLCVNCKYVASIAHEYWCKANLSLVDGKADTARCKDMRSHAGPCGYTGKFFEARGT